MRLFKEGKEKNQRSAFEAESKRRKKCFQSCSLGILARRRGPGRGKRRCADWRRQLEFI